MTTNANNSGFRVQGSAGTRLPAATLHPSRFTTRDSRLATHRSCALVLTTLGALLLATGATAAEQQSLSVVQAQSVCVGDVQASGRLVPQYSAWLGSRLAARITEWGRNEAGEPLDVGMRVKADQLLFSVDPATFKARVDSAQAALASASAALADLIAPPRPEHLAILKAAVAEQQARFADREHDEGRYQRLVEEDKTMPLKRLEEARVELAAARSQQTAAQARLDEAVNGPTATQRAIAEARVKEAQAALASAEIDLRDTQVKAPFDALITKRTKGVGDYVAGAPFVEVLELVTLDHLEADLRLPEAYLPQLVAGQTKVQLSTALLPRELPLTVTRVVQQLDPVNGTFACRVAIPAEQAVGLAAGAFVTAHLTLDQADNAVLIPFRALVMEAGKAYIMLATGGKMQRHEVQISSRLTEGAVIRDGVKPGDRIVVGPPEQLKDGAVLPDYLQPEKGK